jgi:hydrogenase assembly chaperone HypC/HupF
MCLGMPGRVVGLDAIGSATVDFWGVQRTVSLGDLEDFIVRGDYIIAHQGTAVRKIPSDTVNEVLGLYEVLLSEAGEDPIVADVCFDLQEPALAV